MEIFPYSPMGRAFEINSAHRAFMHSAIKAADNPATRQRVRAKMRLGWAQYIKTKFPAMCRRDRRNLGRAYASRDFRMQQAA